MAGIPKSITQPTIIWVLMLVFGAGGLFLAVRDTISQCKANTKDIIVLKMSDLELQLLLKGIGSDVKDVKDYLYRWEPDYEQKTHSKTQDQAQSSS